MDREIALRIIRDCFTHVKVERIFVEYDALADGEVAFVVIPDDQLEEAFRENGFHPRQAAMRSGLTVEVLMSSEMLS